MRRTSLLRVLSICLAILALASTAPRAVGSDIVVSEFRVRGPNGGNDEVVPSGNFRSVGGAVLVPKNGR